MVISSIVGFIRLRNNVFLVDMFLVLIFFSGLFFPLLFHRELLFSKVLIIFFLFTVLFAFGFLAYLVSYGLFSFPFYSIIYKFSSLFHTCQWPICEPREGPYLNGLFFSLLGVSFYLWVGKKFLKFKAKMKNGWNRLWKNLTYWQKGFIIMFLFTLVISFIFTNFIRTNLFLGSLFGEILEQILAIIAIPLCFFPMAILKEGHPALCLYSIFLSPFIYGAIGALIGSIISKIKNADQK